MMEDNITETASDFTVGAIFCDTFSIFLERPFLFLAVALVGWLPSFYLVGTILSDSLQIMGTWGVHWGIAHRGSASFLLSLLLDTFGHGWRMPYALFLLLAFLAAGIAQSLAVYAVRKMLEGDGVSFADCLRQVASCIMPLLRTALFFYLIFLATFAAASWLSFTFDSPVITGLCPVAVVFCIWTVCLPISSLEGLGPLGSISRAEMLTAGCRLRIAVFYALCLAASAFIGWVAIFGVGFFFSGNAAAILLASGVALLAIQTFVCVAIPVVHQTLRAAKQGERHIERETRPALKVAASDMSDFTIGGTLRHTYAILSEYPFVFFGIGLLGCLPMGIACLAFDPYESDGLLLVYFVAFFAINLAQGAAAYAVFQALRDREVLFGDALSKGALSSFGYLLAVTVSFNVVSMAAALLGTFGMTSLASFIQIKSLHIAVWGCFVSAVVLCIWGIAISASAFEHTGPIRSINRSVPLTRGHRCQLLCLYVPLVAVAAAIAQAARIVAARIFPTGELERHMVSFVSGSDRAAALSMLAALLIPFTVALVMNPVVYFGLRTARRGMSLDYLAEMFDAAKKQEAQP